MKPTPVVALGNRVLVAGVDYTVSYGKSNTYAKGSLTITGKGSYTGKQACSWGTSAAAQPLAANLAGAAA